MKKAILIVAVLFSFTAMAQIKPSQMSTATISAFKTALAVPSQAQMDAKLNKSDTITATDLFYTKAQIDAKNAGFTITFDPGSYSTPTDNTTYYYGAFQSLGMTTGAALRQVVIPYNCTLVGWSVTERSTATPSGEASTLYVRINNTTDVSLTNALIFHAPNAPISTYRGVGLTTNLTAGDKIEMKLLTATWATDATSIMLTTTLYFNYR